jgi:hypothetical protein
VGSRPVACVNAACSTAANQPAAASR